MEETIVKADIELLTMQRIHRLVMDLRPDARHRVLSWINHRHSNPVDKTDLPDATTVTKTLFDKVDQVGPGA